MSYLKRYFATGLMVATGFLVSACGTNNSGQASEDHALEATSQAPEPTNTEIETLEPNNIKDQAPPRLEAQVHTSTTASPEPEASNSATGTTSEPDFPGLPEFEFSGDYHEDLRSIGFELTDEEDYDRLTKTLESSYCEWSNYKEDGSMLAFDIRATSAFKDDRTEELMVVMHYGCPERMEHLEDLYLNSSWDQ